MNLVAVSKYLSYLLRHNPGDLRISRDGFVPIKDVMRKLRERFPSVDENVLEELTKGRSPRFEIIDGKIRALYGHSIPVDIKLKSIEDIEVLYHGTTRYAAERILREGLKPQGRQRVHLSPNIEQAIKVGRRRTSRPVVLRIDVKAAKEAGVVFEKANELVYVSTMIPPRFKSLVEDNQPHLRVSRE